MVQPENKNTIYAAVGIAAFLLCCCISLSIIIGYFIYNQEEEPVTVVTDTIPVSSGSASGGPGGAGHAGAGPGGAGPAGAQGAMTPPAVVGFTPAEISQPVAGESGFWKNCIEWAFIDRNGSQYCKNDFGPNSQYLGKAQADCRWSQGKGICSIP